MTRLLSTLFALALLIGAIYWLRFTDEQTVNVTAYGVEKIIMHHSDRDGRIRTNIYYLLNTDHGTYRIGIDGLFAHPSTLNSYSPIASTKLPLSASHYLFGVSIHKLKNLTGCHDD